MPDGYLNVIYIKIYILSNDTYLYWDYYYLNQIKMKLFVLL